MLMAAPSTLWLRAAVEQYETLPVASQTLIDNTLAELDRRQDGGPRSGSPTWVDRDITAGEPAEHLIVHAVVLGPLVVITRLVHSAERVRR